MAGIALLREDGVSFALDVTTKMSISSDVRVTEHPIEDGSVRSDHAQARPRVITLYGSMTATPWASRSSTGGGSRLRSALDTLEASVGMLFDVVDPVLGTFSSYMLTRYPTERGMFGRLPFTIELTEVRIATASYATISGDTISDATAAATQSDGVDLGSVGTTTSSATTTSSTVSRSTASTTATGGDAAAEKDISDLAQLLGWGA